MELNQGIKTAENSLLSLCFLEEVFYQFGALNQFTVWSGENTCQHRELARSGDYELESE